MCLKRFKSKLRRFYKTLLIIRNSEAITLKHLKQAQIINKEKSE